MDLDDFDAALAALPLDDEPIVQSQDAKEAVAYIDREWYTLVNRRGRWMDLIGDYAGSEPFVVDGMSGHSQTRIKLILHMHRRSAHPASLGRPSTRARAEGW